MFKSQPNFIYLASQSPRRIQLLRKLKIPFQTIPSRYRETSRRGETPRERVIRHAFGKARRAVLPKRFKRGGKNIRILGADTLVYFQGRLIGKPRTLAEARKILRAMSGRSHWVYTGIAVIDPKSGRERCVYEKTRVTFKKWERDQIEKYLRRVNPLDKAGAYAIQVKPSIVACCEGSRSNVIGLPLESLRKLLRNG